MACLDATPARRPPPSLSRTRHRPARRAAATTAGGREAAARGQLWRFGRLQAAARALRLERDSAPKNGVGDDEQVARHGHEDDLAGLVLRPQPRDEVGEEARMAERAERRHVERAPDVAAALAEEAPAAAAARLVRPRRDAAERGDGAAVDLAELGQMREELGGGDGAEARDRAQQRRRPRRGAGGGRGGRRSPCRCGRGGGRGWRARRGCPSRRAGGWRRRAGSSPGFPYA